ncbi:MAG: hypothetical protein IKA46_05130 [Clostridia bacterium]|nr:hypothetical protein [Clostridia bacterium]
MALPFVFAARLGPRTPAAVDIYARNAAQNGGREECRACPWQVAAFSRQGILQASARSAESGSTSRPHYIVLP